MKIEIANLDINRLKDECPKAYALLEEFITEGIRIDLEATDLTPEQIVEIMQSLVTHGVKFHHRILYDFFDTQKILIIIDYVSDGAAWYAIINNEEQKNVSDRQEAEIQAMNEAFTLLEIELNK